MTKKIYAAGLIIAVLAVSCVAYAAHVYWSRSLTKQITVIGIDAELLKPDGISYLNKVKATALVDDKVFVTIYAENFEVIWLNCTWISDAVGLNVDVQGLYVSIEYAGGVYQVNPVGSSFDAEGYHTVNKTLMMYKTPGAAILGCGALQLTFTFDTELVTTPGDYSVDMLFQMGFV